MVASSLKVNCRPPPLIARAALSFALLMGFYALVLAIVGLLFALPVGMIYLATRSQGLNVQSLLLVPVCWIPAGLLAIGLFSTKPAKFVPPSKKLERSEAPELFNAVAKLAERANTAPPTDIYLTPLPNLAVVEEGGWWRGRRVLVLGAPLLRLLSVEEMRAGIAHELGHFVGGDTRLSRLVARVRSQFESVARAVEREPFRDGTQHYAIEWGFLFARGLGHAVVEAYAKLFLSLTRPMDQRQELAADALAASLVGTSAMARALDKIVVSAPLYLRYLQVDAGFAISQGAMPTDLWAGFERMRERILNSELGKTFVNGVRNEQADKYDTHPALAVRLRAIGASDDESSEPLGERADSLFSSKDFVDSWLVEATCERLINVAVTDGMTISRVRMLPWAQITSEIYETRVREAARVAAEVLYPLFPEARAFGAMFANVWRGVNGARFAEIALKLNPALAHFPAQHANEKALVACCEALAALWRGALLEAGGRVEESLGEAALGIQFQGESVIPEHMISDCLFANRGRPDLIDAWANRLSS